MTKIGVANPLQNNRDIEGLEKRISGRQPAMFAEAKWALSGNEQIEGSFETPPVWVRRSIRAYVHYGLGNPRAKPAVEVLNTRERKEAAALGLALASDALIASTQNSLDGKILAEEIRKIGLNAGMKMADKRKAIEDEAASFSAVELVDFESHKLKGMDVLASALSVRDDVDDPRIGILYCLWVFWSEVRFLKSVPDVDRWLRSVLTCPFSLKLTEKICGEIGIEFAKVKKRAK